MTGQLWEEHLWGQPPSAVRRAQLDLNPQARIASTPPPLQDSSDAPEAVERCRDWHKSGTKKIADHRRPSPRTNRQMEKERYSFRNRLHAPSPGPFSQPRNRLILCGSFSSLRQFAMAVRLLFSKSSHPLVRPPSALYGFLLRNPDELTDSVPSGDFTVANWRCFYTLRAAGPYPVKTQARVWGMCRMLSLFLSTTRSWRSVFKCNRIHRNGG
jgi:hypothetical protein